MKISRKMLEGAEARGLITGEQVEALQQYFIEQTENQPQFSFTHILYYLGGLVAIGAMTVFMSLGWQSFGGAAIVVIAALYAMIGIAITNRLSNQGMAIPAGVCATFVVCLVPLAIYGLQEWMGIWPDREDYLSFSRDIAWHRFFMEIGTVLAAILVLKKYAYPFLVMPLAIALGVMTADVAEMLLGNDVTWQLRRVVSLIMGLLITCLAIGVDIRSHRHGDYAFWLYLVGVTAFWSGLTLLESSHEFTKFIYFCINLIMIGLGAILVRRVFVVFGALGSCGYLGYLAFDVFRDSWLFPITLTVIGLGIIYLGILWQRHEQAISQRARAMLPMALRDMLSTRQ
ncbi:DUF2157 domain-containing protein [Pseudohongiella nitratireducens]|uniref:DUF2157 domain-containing protein n=1 Tax=Pseudohongiella nitratireducens TaxID=1768907 RepID=UPI0030ED1B5A|tara:strand:- start:1478 stop:2506 length:1029 start_codon:yes stop_codon:yes gene_type:complete